MFTGGLTSHRSTIYTEYLKNKTRETQVAIIEIQNDAHWHELRAQNIGGSDVAALLGVSPYKSKWQLFMEKSGKLEAEDLSQNKAVQAGVYLEAGIAKWASDIWFMNLEKSNVYHTVDDVPGMGASLDYYEPGGAPVEIKWSSRGHGWHYEGEWIIEAPEYYLLQVQHQIACVGASHGWLIALIDNEPRRMLVQRHDRVIDAIKSGITQFWADIRNGVEPDPDFSLDGDAIGRLMESTPYAEIELDSDAAPLFLQFKTARDTAKLATERADELKAELLLLAQKRMEQSNAPTDKAIVRCGDNKMSISKIAPNPGKEVTEDMVGTFINARKGYQTVRIS